MPGWVMEVSSATSPMARPRSDRLPRGAGCVCHRRVVPQLSVQRQRQLLVTRCHDTVAAEAVRTVFLSPRANRSAYFGGGLSYGHQNFGGGAYNATNGYYSSDWEGSGLQGELTAGYEFARVTTFRMFVQADAILPFYEATSETYSIPSRTSTVPPVPTTSHRYAPSLIVSIGVGR